MIIEKMSDFFAARVDGYDEHMLTEIEGCKEGYLKMAQLLPQGASNLLDLGCGTGLELEEIFKIYPSISVCGIDLTQAMLDRLHEKHPDKNLTLINASYFDVDFGENTFDAAVSFQSLHHFSHKEKTALYTRLFHALKPKGRYIECDYMVETQEEEDSLFKENERIRREQNIPDGEFYHYDTPCTITNQIAMLETAGFNLVKMVWRKQTTTIIVADTE